MNAIEEIMKAIGGAVIIAIVLAVIISYSMLCRAVRDIKSMITRMSGSNCPRKDSENETSDKAPEQMKEGK